jgi:hypothetical protein
MVEIPLVVVRDVGVVVAMVRDVLLGLSRV